MSIDALESARVSEVLHYPCVIFSGGFPAKITFFQNYGHFSVPIYLVKSEHPGRLLLLLETNTLFTDSEGEQEQVQFVGVGVEV